MGKQYLRVTPVIMKSWAIFLFLSSTSSTPVFQLISYSELTSSLRSPPSPTFAVSPRRPSTTRGDGATYSVQISPDQGAYAVFFGTGSPGNVVAPAGVVNRPRPVRIFSQEGAVEVSPSLEASQPVLKEDDEQIIEEEPVVLIEDNQVEDTEEDESDNVEEEKLEDVEEDMVEEEAVTEVAVVEDDGSQETENNLDTEN